MMAEVCVTKSKSKEEFDVENSELTRNLSIGSLSEAVEKVLLWFARNDECSSLGDCFEALSLKSSKGSIINDDESFNTPSFQSDDEDLHENLKESCLKVKELKTPVVPIQLNHQDNYDVTLINFQSLDSFFVTIKRADDKKWNRLIRRLKKLQIKNRLEPLEEFIRGNPCLVEVNGELHRAIVQNCNTKTAICFGIDTGKVYLVNLFKDFIYYMSPKIRNTIEFQAINCKLFDVRLPHDPDITKLVYDTVISKISKPQVKVVKTKASRFIDDNCMAFDNYEVMLFGHDRKTSINQQIAFSIQGMKDYDLDNF
ncbi:unnamed protein product [Chironomus riparius]|uniref:Tudor domain-containing protein n=1 Tax=Chironomus riparius TaxID=315576 RepID=A0A9N9WT88_9DIPT|nr:unnamed protein product [Chironomus riparius]